MLEMAQAIQPAPDYDSFVDPNASYPQSQYRFTSVAPSSYPAWVNASEPIPEVSRQADGRGRDGGRASERGRRQRSGGRERKRSKERNRSQDNRKRDPREMRQSPRREQSKVRSRSRERRASGRMVNPEYITDTHTSTSGSGNKLIKDRDRRRSLPPEEHYQDRFHITGARTSYFQHSIDRFPVLQYLGHTPDTEKHRDNELYLPEAIETKRSRIRTAYHPVKVAVCVVITLLALITLATGIGVMLALLAQTSYTTVNLSGSVRLPDETFISAYSIKLSPEYSSLQNRFCTAIGNVITRDDFLECSVTSLRSGSVIVEFVLMFRGENITRDSVLTSTQNDLYLATLDSDIGGLRVDQASLTLADSGIFIVRYEQSAFNGSVTLDQTFSASLTDNSTAAYQALTTEFCQDVSTSFQSSNLSQDYRGCQVTELQPGSVIVVFMMVFETQIVSSAFPATSSTTLSSTTVSASSQLLTMISSLLVTGLSLQDSTVNPSSVFVMQISDPVLVSQLFTAITSRLTTSLSQSFTTTSSTNQVTSSSTNQPTVSLTPTNQVTTTRTIADSTIQSTTSAGATNQGTMSPSSTNESSPTIPPSNETATDSDPGNTIQQSSTNPDPRSNSTSVDISTTPDGSNVTDSIPTRGYRLVISVSTPLGANPFSPEHASLAHSVCQAVRSLLDDSGVALDYQQCFAKSSGNTSSRVFIDLITDLTTLNSFLPGEIRSMFDKLPDHLPVYIELISFEPIHDQEWIDGLLKLFVTTQSSIASTSEPLESTSNEPGGPTFEPPILTTDFTAMQLSTEPTEETTSDFDYSSKSTVNPPRYSGGQTSETTDLFSYSPTDSMFDDFSTDGVSQSSESSDYFSTTPNTEYDATDFSSSDGTSDMSPGYFTQSFEQTTDYGPELSTSDSSAEWAGFSTSSDMDSSSFATSEVTDQSTESTSEGFDLSIGFSTYMSTDWSSEATSETTDLSSEATSESTDWTDLSTGSTDDNTDWLDSSESTVDLVSQAKLSSTESPRVFNYNVSLVYNSTAWTNNPDLLRHSFCDYLEDLTGVVFARCILQPNDTIELTFEANVQFAPDELEESLYIIFDPLAEYIISITGYMTA